MKLYRHTTALPDSARGAVVALGNFDGVHRGHQAVIAAARAAAAGAGAPLAVLTFEPHPRSLFRPDDPPFRLTSLRTKARRLERLGVDLLYVIPFNRAFSRLPAEGFVTGVLIRDLRVRHVVAGSDFMFGHDRLGSLALLEAMGAGHGFGVTGVEGQTEADGPVFSSTRVRRLLREGRPDAAAEILGSPWEIEGRVRHGAQLARRLGFPTANLDLGATLRPAYGVYAVRAGIDAAAATIWHPGVANLGRRPTVDGLREWLEVHLFDTRQDLYGRHLRVQIIAFLRPERKFAGIDALQAQIQADAAAARAVLGVN